MGFINNKLVGRLYKLRYGLQKEMIVRFVDVQLCNHAGNVIQKVHVLAPQKDKPWWSRPTEDKFFEQNWFLQNSLKLGANSCFGYDNFYTHNWDAYWTENSGWVITSCKDCKLELNKVLHNRSGGKELLLSCDELIVKDIIT
jgi:hypothetical protein